MVSVVGWWGGEWVDGEGGKVKGRLGGASDKFLMKRTPKRYISRLPVVRMVSMKNVEGSFESDAPIRKPR